MPNAEVPHADVAVGNNLPVPACRAERMETHIFQTDSGEGRDVREKNMNLNKKIGFHSITIRLFSRLDTYVFSSWWCEEQPY